MRKLRATFFLVLATTPVFLNGFSLPFEVKGINFPKTSPCKKLDFTRQIFTQKFYRMTLDFTQPEVQRYIALYGRAHNRQVIVRALKRSRPFCLFIYEQLSKRDLPEELFYLPIIESEFLNVAKSSAGALGMWQIMQNSLSHNMCISSYRDDRLNFWKATESALTRLKENYKNLGDWRLALCAYNAGYARIRTIIKENGFSNFWNLARNKLLPKDTCEYIPKFYAIVYLATRSVQNNLEIHWDKSMDWSLVEIKKPLSLQEISRLTGIPTELLCLGNAELKQMHTPKDSFSFFLKVPSNWRVKVEKVLIAQEKTKEPVTYTQIASYAFLNNLKNEKIL